MGRWTQSERGGPLAKIIKTQDAPGNGLVAHSKAWAILIANAHNAACDAYEARIAELETELAEAMDDERVTSDLFEAACNDLGDAQDKLARIAELVKPLPVADLVKAGTEAPRLLAERHAKIRAILEEEM